VWWKRTGKGHAPILYEDELLDRSSGQDKELTHRVAIAVFKDCKSRGLDVQRKWQSHADCHAAPSLQALPDPLARDPGDALLQAFRASCKTRSQSAGLGRLRFLHQLKLVRHSGELA
jgi:hypothetical protein